MSIRKYRSIAEADSVEHLATPSENLRAAFDLIEICYRLRPFEPDRGVRRGREANGPTDGQEPGRRAPPDAR